MLLLLIACNDPAPATCPDLPETPSVAACYGGDGVDPADTGGASATVAWSGTVAEVGTGFPDACTVEFGSGSHATAWWIRFTTNDGDAWVGIDTPGSTAPAVGTEVVMTAAWEQGEFSPTQAHVEVEADGVMGAWVGQSGAANLLDAPSSVSIEEGDATCETNDECGTWSVYDLEASVNGASVTISEGETATAGGYTWAVAALRQSFGSIGCPDWYVADALVGIGR